MLMYTKKGNLVTTPSPIEEIKTKKGIVD